MLFDGGVHKANGLAASATLTTFAFPSFLSFLGSLSFLVFVMARFSLVLVSLALALLSSATPMPHSASVPRDATKLAYDEVAKRIIAYDAHGTHLGFVKHESIQSKRDGGACSALSSDDVQKLPGWDTLNQKARDNWGTGSRKVVTNDKDLPEQPAQVCAEDAGDMTINGDPQCTTQSQTLDTTVTGTNGTATVSQTTGTKYSSSQTVSQMASIAIGETVSVPIRIPKIANMTEATSLTATFTNTLSNTETSESNQQTTQTVAIAVPKDSTCGVSFDVTTCTTQGSGQVPFVATGWVWFEYDKKTKGHYKWALNIDDILSNKDDRSTFMKFNAQVSTDTNGEYEATC